MRSRTRTASWLISGLLVVTLVSAGFERIMAQPKSEASRPAFDPSEAAFESLGDRYIVNMSNVAYTSDDGVVFDIYFACSSAKAPDPLRLTDANDIKHARTFFNDEDRYGKQFLKVNRYCINVRNVAFVERKEGSVIVNFNTRIWESFVYLKLVGLDAEAFRKKRQDF